MRTLARALIVPTIVFLSAAPAAADTVHILIQGDGASGSVDGAAFSGVDWALEVDVDDSVADSDPALFFGTFQNSVQAARIEIDGTLYELGGSSSTGYVQLGDISKQGFANSSGDRVTFGPSSGGGVTWLAGDDLVYPALFTDNNDLTSVNPGTSASNTTTDAYNNSSSISFEVLDCTIFGYPPNDEECLEIFGDMDRGLTAASGELIAISAGSGPTGSWSVSVSTSPALAPPAPIVCDGTLYTGAELLSDPNVTLGGRIATASGTSAHFATGTANTTLVDIPLFGAAELLADDYVTVSATINRTRQGNADGQGDDDMNLVVTDGANGLGEAAHDNYGGVLIGYDVAFSGADYGFTAETFLTSGGGPLPPIGGITEYDMGVALGCSSTTVSGQWGAQTGTGTFSTALARQSGLSLAILAENTDEAYQVNYVCITTEVTSFNDACDLCPTGNCTDTDGDGTEDSVDVCPGGDDSVDGDADGTPDACDACPVDPYGDSDGDGSCDSADVCPFDADDDADADGVCADLDICPLDADNDADADGICAEVDSCPLDAANDADGDGICGNEDSCPGGDDTLDVDNDGTADG